MIDVSRLRSETPGVSTVTHLNNAGASLMPTPVIEAIVDYLEHEAAHGGYETHAALADRIEAAYEGVAELVGARSSSISLADNATRAWDLAFYGFDWSPGDRILTTTSEYASNLSAFLDVRDRFGVRVEVVPDTPAGELDVDALDRMIDDRVGLIAVNHMPTNGGLVNPVADIGSVAARSGIPFLLDACQTVGQIPIDVEAIGCTMLSATSRKYLRGPRGVGFLYVAPDMVDRVRPPFIELETAEVRPEAIVLRSDRRRFETWEKNYAAIAGFGVAVRYALDVGVEAMWERIQELAAHVRRSIEAVPQASVRDLGQQRGGIVTIELAGVDAFAVRDALRARSINVSVTTDESAPIDMDRRGIDEMLRVSVHAFNTTEEIDLFASSLRDVMDGS